MKDLFRKVIVITGANRGIGLAIYEYLEELGEICVNLSKSPCLDGTKNSIIVDITEKTQVVKAIEEIEASFGPIYGIVSNAGVINDSLFSDMSFEKWDQVIRTNLYGNFHLLNYALKTMQQRKSGSIVFINSSSGEMGNIGQANYSTSKAALFGLMKTLAKEYAISGIRINSISPGAVDTEMTQNMPTKELLKIKKATPFRRLANVKEIAAPVAFLLSNELSSYITGENIRVNGGLLM